MRSSSRAVSPGRARRLAVAVVAVLGVSALPLTGAAPAGAADPVGTVTQDGDTPPVLVNGSDEGAVLDFTVTLPASVQGTVNARLLIPEGEMPGAGYDPDRFARGLTTSCRVDDGPVGSCPWSVPAEEADAGSIVLDLPTTQARTTYHYSTVTTAGGNVLPEDQPLTGAIRLNAADGTVLARGDVRIQFHRVQLAEDEAAVYGRDAAGVLWKYDGTNDLDSAFRPRTRVGPGWQIYTSITPIFENSVDGRGDLVARDKAGVLWYYQGSGNAAQPFLRRVRVGSGWNIYTTLMGGPWSQKPGTSRLRHTLIGRDKAGKLWLYEVTGDMNRPLTARIQAGHGWNVYTSLFHYGDGALGRDSAGVLWVYSSSGLWGGDPFMPRRRVGPGWNTYSALAGIKDANWDGAPDVLARDKTGHLWLYTSSAWPQAPQTRHLIGPGWNIYNLIF